MRSVPGAARAFDLIELQGILAGGLTLSPDQIACLPYVVRWPAW